MKEEDYLWTEVEGKRIFYSLDTFFQANLSILPTVLRKIKGLNLMDRSTIFYDLYGGVGLFGICLADEAAQVILVEESVHSVKLAKFNCAYHALTTMTVHEGRVGKVLPLLQPFAQDKRHVAMIDPPRQGLDPKEAQLLAGMREFDALMYLSCKPEALVRDLKIFSDGGWRVAKVVP
jgi:tRNA/tmRNA/rRNA uracil-C5-methylase (TrmA/RlmC/RlmD family)